MFSNRKLKRRLNSDGTFVECQYLLFINNLDPITFSTREQLNAYISRFRKENDVFKLNVFRVETYSL